MTTAHTDNLAAHRAAEAESVRRAAEANKAHPLSPEQKEAADIVAADKKVADERAAAFAKADADYRADVAAAAAKRTKALEKFVPENIAECAWEATKDPADPLWNDVQVDFRGKMETIAADVEAHGLVSEVPSAFEVKVDELVKERKVKFDKDHPHRPLTAAEVAAGKKLPHPQTPAEAAAEKRADEAKAVAAKAAADAKAKDDAKK